jgi:hypothetical protein
VVAADEVVVASDEVVVAPDEVVVIASVVVVAPDEVVVIASVVVVVGLGWVTSGSQPLSSTSMPSVVQFRPGKNCTPFPML